MGGTGTRASATDRDALEDDGPPDRVETHTHVLVMKKPPWKSPEHDENDRPNPPHGRHHPLPEHGWNRNSSERDRPTDRPTEMLSKTTGHRTAGTNRFQSFGSPSELMHTCPVHVTESGPHAPDSAT